MTSQPDDAGPVRGRTAWLRRATAPVRSVTTLLAGIYLVLGGVVAAAYGVLVVGFVQMMAEQTLRPSAVVLAVVAAVIVLAPPFLGAVRTLEILAVRTFLDVDVPVPPRSGPAPSAATRWRAAAWYGLHLAMGAAVTFALVVAVPSATQLGLQAAGVDRGPLLGLLPRVDGPGGVVLAILAAILFLLALAYVTALARVVLREAARPLLGPDQSERIAELENAARRADERGRLARELHDSVGHALTITTLQAAAAARQLESDPEAARRSLAAIEETGRSAMADLDHVLGLLRATDGPRQGPLPPTRTLEQLPDLVDDARRAGAQVRLTTAVVGVVPPAASREAYRVVQEALTNALRHAPGAPVDVHVGTADRALRVDVVNPVDGSEAVSRGRRGRGLDGMAERVRLLGGHVTAGPEDGRWVVRVRFPLPARGSGS